VFALVAVILLAGAPWCGRPLQAARLAGWAALLPALAAVCAGLVLLVGPEAGVYLRRAPESGLLLCCAAALCATACAWRATRES
jgi:hypothetical protein